MIELNESEKVIRTVRKHWFVLISSVIVLLLFVAIPVVLLFFFHLIPIESFLTFSGNTFYAGSFFLFSWLLVVWMIGWNMWTDYYLDVLIITDKRIFDINQNGLFRRESSSFRIDKIQNITVDQKGIIETLLDFGSIQLETAGEREDFIVHYISFPYEIKKFINEMQDNELEKSQLVHLNTVNPTTTSTQELTRNDGDGL